MEWCDPGASGCHCLLGAKGCVPARSHGIMWDSSTQLGTVTPRQAHGMLPIPPTAAPKCHHPQTAAPSPMARTDFPLPKTPPPRPAPFQLPLHPEGFQLPSGAATHDHPTHRAAVQGDLRPSPRPTPCHRGDPTPPPGAPTHSAPRRAGPEGAGGPCGCGGRSVWRGAVRPGPARPGSTPPPPPPAARSRRRGAAGEVWSRRGAARGRRGSEHRGRPSRAGGWATRSGRRRAASGGAGCAQQQVSGDGTGSPGAAPPGAEWDGGGEGAARASPRAVDPCGSLGGRG